MFIELLSPHLMKDYTSLNLEKERKKGKRRPGFSQKEHSQLGSIPFFFSVISSNSTARRGGKWELFHHYLYFTLKLHNACVWFVADLPRKFADSPWNGFVESADPCDITFHRDRKYPHAILTILRSFGRNVVQIKESSWFWPWFTHITLHLQRLHFTRTFHLTSRVLI